jgi:hypothetical protein
MIPTLLIDGKVRDYFEDRQNWEAHPESCFYDHTNDEKPTRTTLNPGSGQSNAYDNGGLWP